MTRPYGQADADVPPVEEVSTRDEANAAADQGDRDDRLRADRRKGATEPPKWEQR